MRSYIIDARMTVPCFLEHVLINSGQPEQGLRAGDAAIAQARREGQASALCGALAFRAASMLPRNDPASVLPYAEECIAIATEIGLVHWLAIATGYRGWALARTGAATDGVVQIRRAIAVYRATGADVAIPAFLVLLAEVQMIEGQSVDAIATTDEALAQIERTGEQQWESILHCVRGDIFNSLADPGRAEAEFQLGLSIAQRQQGRAWELRAALGLAKLWCTQHKSAQARALLAAACSGFSEPGGPPDLSEARKLLGVLSLEA
jgi:ATP/maltotriose-dependent transcriptional regulator MalT